MPKFGFLKRTPKKPPTQNPSSSPKLKKDKENQNIAEKNSHVMSRESSKLSDHNSKIPVFSAKMGKETTHQEK